MPDLMTVAETGFPGYEAAQWYGILAPAKTPRQAIDAIRERTVAALNDQGANRKLTDAGYIVVGSEPGQFKSYLKSEVDRLGALVRKLGLKAN